MDGRPINLLEAMFTSQQALATVPHDKIFGLLGLCYDGTALVPGPNYEQSIEELLQDLTRHFIHLYRSLDFVFAVELDGTTQSTLPYWTPNWLDPWSPTSTKLLDLQPQSNPPFFSAGTIDEPHLLRVEGRVLARCLETGYWAVAGHLSRCTPLETHNVLCELLFLDSFLPISESGHPVSTATSLAAWFTAARQVLRDLYTPGNGRSELRGAIHVIHLEEHHMCSLRRGNKWQAQEEPWARHLCDHPDYPMDYELNIFNEVMMWLDETLGERGSGDHSHLVIDFLNPVEEFWSRSVDLESQTGGVLPYTEEIARSIIHAARQRRQLFDTTTGHLALVNSLVKRGDLIFQMQGSTASVVLRPFSISDRKIQYKIISKVHISTSDNPNFVPNPEYVDPKIQTFDIC